MVEVLFWPALLAYGEAAVALVGEARRPGAAGRLAIWSVRVGWLLQTGLLLAQALDARAFPWSSRGGALTLLVWLVVGGYLVWGCRPRYRLLGLAIMPPAALLLLGAYVAGGADAAGDRPGLLLAGHVALMLAGFAGFAVAAALSAVFLWHERLLKRRSATVLRVRIPPLAAVDALAPRVVAVSLAVLTVGIALGAASLVAHGGGLDLAMAATAPAWGIYVGLLALRRRARLGGRRAAILNLTAFAVSLAALSIAHFA